MSAAMPEPDLNRVRIVLVETTHAGNVGAAARAMANMGLSDLRLVAPVCDPLAEAARARAAGADRILERARTAPTLAEAVGDSHYVVGLSARRRSIEWPNLSPREAASQLAAESAGGPVAVLFGRESRGLANAHIDRCNRLVTIAADPVFPSINLAGAVLLMAYEIRLAFDRGSIPPRQPPRGSSPPATAGQLDAFYGHLESALADIGFLRPPASRRLLRKIIRIFVRAGLSEQEVNILRGVLTAAQNRSRR